MGDDTLPTDPIAETLAALCSPLLKTLGVTVPPSLVARANQIIQ
jgi:hypothetical protein